MSETRESTSGQTAWKGTFRQRLGTAWWRGFLGFFGVFGLINVLANLLGTGANANLLWLDLRLLLPGLAGELFVAIACTALLAWSVAPCRVTRRRATRRMVRGAVAALALVCSVNALHVWWLAATGTLPLSAGVLLPLSAGLATAFGWLAWRMPSVALERAPLAWSVPAAGAVVPLVFALAHMLSFGGTDYRRGADVIVVFGARVLPDGQPSDVLADRTATAIALYHAGYAPRLLFSGGPGEPGSDTHEVLTMKRMAREAGVPRDAILLDFEGLNTSRTVRNVAQRKINHSYERACNTRPRVLAVSNNYHLARIKWEFEQTGLAAFTVAATQRYVYTRTPRFVFREAAAFWLYYTRTLLQRRDPAFSVRRPEAAAEGLSGRKPEAGSGSRKRTPEADARLMPQSCRQFGVSPSPLTSSVVGFNFNRL